MALEKIVVQPDGVTTTYHRIVRIDTHTNVLVLVEVASYASAESRQAQIAFEEAQALGAEVMAPPYIATSFYSFEYADGLTASDVYGMLKGLGEYEGATDC